MLAFIRTACGALEGIGYNTFGRPDVELYQFYHSDLETGKLTREEAYELIRAFLLTWDYHYDHDMKMVGYADHELENTYTIVRELPAGKGFANICLIPRKLYADKPAAVLELKLKAVKRAAA